MGCSDSHVFPRGFSLVKEGRANDAGFVETSEDGVEDDVPFCWIVTNSGGFEVGVRFVPEILRLLSVAGVC